jgi:plasmid stabilization system protein ParE
MPYQIRRAPQARGDIRNFIRHLKREASEETARKYFAELEHDIIYLIGNTPNSFSWFHETGPPYRAKLFRLARTTYWIIYVVDDANNVVELVRFWNSARKPGTHGL